MKKQIAKFSDYEKNRENPFMSQAMEQINNHTVKKYRSSTGTDKRAVLQAMDSQTGEILGHTSFIRQIECDEQEFIKFYLRDFQVFFGLSEKAMRVFGYILTLLKPDSDEFVFLIDECLQKTPYKGKNSIYSALAELISAEIIARGRTEVFFYINPMVVFNGNRVTFAKTYVNKAAHVRQIKKEAENKNQLSLFNDDSQDVIL
ncbi:RepA protein [Bacteroides sp. CG01]|uniref:hypothetical protein n=1 Tax=Bacteroides sp. CG01 TaxID=3096000 RepID=UPI002AFDD08D|nr:hypothetical protein [Bacteroides sp. CG01]